MQVEEVLSFADYWNDKRFRNRRPSATSTPDNIYRPGRDGVLVQVPNHVHDAKSVATDLGGKNVLLSRRYWYFGNSSPMIPTDLVHLVHTGIGHAVNKGRRRDDVNQLVKWLRAWPMGLRGTPVDPTLVNMKMTTQRSCLSASCSSGKPP
jgi:hypothetical protein